MFAIAFDLDVAETERHHPRTVAQAYADIRRTLAACGFDWIQGSVYVQPNGDLSGVYTAIASLKAMPWFGPSVRDIRVFRIENWSDFTPIVKDV